MNRLLQFASLICLIYFASCFNLTNLCREDVFFMQKSNISKETVLINSYLRLSLKKQLPKVGEYYISDLKRPKYLNSDDLTTLRKLHEEYENLLLEIYNRLYIKFLNTNKSDDIAKKLAHYNSLEAKFREIVSFSNPKFASKVRKTRDFYYRRMRRTPELLENLNKIRENLLTNFLFNSNDLQTVLSNLDISPSQEPSFSGLFLNAYYSKAILVLKGFELNNASKLFFSADSYGMIDFDLLVPFSNLKYDSEVGNNCTNASNLTPFYINKR